VIHLDDQAYQQTAFAGMIFALVILWGSHPEEVLLLLRDAGSGLFLAGFAHILPMLANARDWQTLIRGANRPTLLSMLKLVRIRESVHCMLPVARIGGEHVSFQILRRSGVSFTADMRSRSDAGA
jgi:hypothetical protein